MEKPISIELERTDWQGVFTLVNIGGIYASLAPQLLKKMSDQLQMKEPRPAAGNGEDLGRRPDKPVEP